MTVLRVRNVHEALPRAVDHLGAYGLTRQSRNGPVRLASGPVTTVYERPWEKVLFWPDRDANPFFHLYEALWMLAGRNDVAGPARYAKNMLNYSDDGVTLHGAYGDRWRQWGGDDYPKHYCLDQLKVVAERLAKDPTDRRCVVDMWDPMMDLGRDGKDFPCNLTITFQRNTVGDLDMVVFNRSNDIVWGAYGANAVHMAFLQEYLAHWIDCNIGVYTQISVNWHAYVGTFEHLQAIRPDRAGYLPNPYRDNTVRHVPIDVPYDQLDQLIHDILWHADHDDLKDLLPSSEWGRMVWRMLLVHELYRTLEAPEKYTKSLTVLQADKDVDWIRAGREWIERRYVKWQNKETHADPVEA
jgi:thymidylate synthase